MKSNVKFVIELDGKNGKQYQLSFWQDMNRMIGIEVKGPEFLAVATNGENPKDILKMANMLQ